jgi:hypothetical protein
MVCCCRTVQELEEGIGQRVDAGRQLVTARDSVGRRVLIGSIIPIAPNRSVEFFRIFRSAVSLRR